MSLLGRLDNRGAGTVNPPHDCHSIIVFCDAKAGVAKNIPPNEEQTSQINYFARTNPRLASVPTMIFIKLWSAQIVWELPPGSMAAKNPYWRERNSLVKFACTRRFVAAEMSGKSFWK
jgi:hypothetical protein